MKLFKNILQFLLFCLLVFFAYQSRDQINAKIRGAINYYVPCTLPITYSIGDFDTRFGLTKAEFLTDMAQAESVWERQAGKELFHYVETGGVLKLNLVYDNRQATTEKLQKIDGVISGKQETYDALKSNYTILNQKLTNQRIQYNQAQSQVETMRNALNRDVTYWNQQGGAPKKEYDRLQQEQQNFNTKITALNRQLAELNSTVKAINDLASRMNALIEELHLNVAKYNTARGTNGDEFSEGEYVRDISGERINIYEFSNDSKLERVLIHELGHALGLQHVDDVNAIMYRLNAGKKETLTESDKIEIERVCRT